MKAHADILSGLFEKFSPEECGLVLKAVLDYFARGVIPSFASRELDLLFKAVVAVDSPADALTADEPCQVATTPMEVMTRRKEASLASADLVTDERVAGRIRACNNVVKEDTKGKLSGLPCNCRSCADCRAQWAARQQAVMKQVLDDFEKNFSAAYQYTTFTVRNVDSSHLAAMLDKMNKAWAKMMKWSKVANAVLGSYKVVGVTKAEDGKAHPHFHVLFAFRPGRRFTDLEWKKLWQEAMGLDYSPQVKPENLKDRYATRFKLDYLTGQSIDPAFEGELRNKRLSSATGIFKKLSAQAKKDYKDYRETLPKRDPKVIHLWEEEKSYKKYAAWE